MFPNDGAVVSPVPPYSTPTDVVAETTPLFACSGPLSVLMVNPPLNVFVFVNVLAVYVFGIVVEELMKELTLVSPYEPIHVVPIAKHPDDIENPTLEVEVAWPEIFNPESVVVPKPIDETESCVAVDEPTTKPTVSPPSGLTDRRANGEDVPTPT